MGNNMDNENIKNLERTIVRKREELPHLKEGYGRLVHLTSPSAAEGIIQAGLNYEKQGMITSIARIWSKESEVQFETNDPRFGGNVAVVMDVPFEELKLHNSVTKSPGVIPPDYIVGVVTNEDKKHKE